MKKFKKNQAIQTYQTTAIVLASVAGMVNLSSFFLLYSFSSNITGYFAMLAEETSSEKWFQVAVVFAWISLFFTGSLFSTVITNLKSFSKSTFINYLPILVICSILVSVSYYGSYYYDESIQETELILGALLFAMGAQNGFSASISNLVVKNTHLTGATTDLAVLLGRKLMWHPNDEAMNATKQRLKLVALTVSGYIAGGLFGGLFVRAIGFWSLSLAASVLMTYTLLYGLSPLLIRFYVRFVSKPKLSI